MSHFMRGLRTFHSNFILTFYRTTGASVIMQSTFIIPQELVNENVSVLKRKHHCRPTLWKKNWKKKGGGVQPTKQFLLQLSMLISCLSLQKKGGSTPPFPKFPPSIVKTIKCRHFICCRELVNVIAEGQNHPDPLHVDHLELSWF